MYSFWQINRSFEKGNSLFTQKIKLISNNWVFVSALIIICHIVWKLLSHSLNIQFFLEGKRLRFFRARKAQGGYVEIQFFLIFSNQGERLCFSSGKGGRRQRGGCYLNAMHDELYTSPPISPGLHCLIYCNISQNSNNNNVEIIKSANIQT